MEASNQDQEGFTERSAQEIYESADHNKKLSYFFNSNKIISSPLVVQEFFRHFDQYSTEKQENILKEILKALRSVTTNAYILTGQMNGKSRMKSNGQLQKNQEQRNLIGNIVYLLIENVNNRIIFNLLQQFFQELLPYSNLSDSILYEAISMITLNFQESKVNASQLFVTTTIIKNLFHAKIMAERQPNNMLVFHGHNSIEIQPYIQTKQINWVIKDGYSLLFWINLENIKSSVQASLSKLFTFHAPQAGGVQSYLIDNKIYYRIIGPKYSQPQIGSNGIFLGELQPKKWNFLAFQHQTHHTFQKSKLKLFVNKNKPTVFNLDPPKISSNCQAKYNFFENIYCKTSTICLFPFLLGQEGIQQYNKNINSVQYVKQAKAYVFQNRQGKVYERSGLGFCKKINFQRNLDMNFQLVLPLFYLLRYQNQDEQYPTLNQLLNVFILFLRKSASTQFQAIKNGYMKTISQLICQVNRDIFDSNTIKSILHIKHTITDTNLLGQYFSNFLWPLLKAKISIVRKEEILQIIKNAFVQNLNQHSSLIGLDEMINLLQNFQGSSLTCCETHFHIASKKYEKRPKAENVIFGLQKKTQNYIFALIQNTLTNSKQQFPHYVYKLIRLLCLKYSPCLILQLMRFIRRNLTLKLSQKGGQNQVKEIMKYLQQKKVHFILIHLIENQFFAEIKAQGVKLIYSLLLKKSSLDETYISNLISKSLWKINEFVEEDRQIRQQKDQQHKPPIVEPIILKNEKESKPPIIQSVQEQDDQQFKLVGPQAPALSNRLKGKKSFDFGFINQSKKPKNIEISQEDNIQTVQIRPSSQFVIDPLKKPKKFVLSINTEAINQMYTFGGQKGQQLVISEDQEQLELEKIIKLAKKCVLAMKGKNMQAQDKLQQTKPSYVLPPMTTKNKVAVNKKNFNLNLIEQQEPEVKISTPPVKKSIKTPTSVKSSKSENVFTLYNSLLQSCFGVNLQTTLILNTKVQVPSILGIFFKWIPQTDLQTKFLNDLEIILQSNDNITLIIELPQLYDFLFELSYKCLLFQEMKQKRVYTEKLQNIIKFIFTFIYKEDIAGFSKFSFILNWVQSKKDQDYQPKCLFLTSRYVLLLILQCIQELLIMNNTNNPIMQRNFQCLATILDTIRKIVPQNFDQVNIDNYQRVVFTADFQLPVSLVPYFKSDWADFILYQKYLFIFKRFYCTQWYNKGLKHFQLKENDFLSFLMQSSTSLLQKQATYYLRNNFIVSLIELQRAMLLEIQHNQPKQAEEFGNQAVWQTILLIILVQMHKQKTIKSQRSEIILSFLKSCKLLAQKGIERIVQIVPMLSGIKHFLSISNNQLQSSGKSTISTQILDDIISNYIPEYLLNMGRTDLESFILNFSEVWIPNQNHYKKIHSELFLTYKQKIKKEEDFNFIQFISNILQEENERSQYTQVVLQAYQRVVKNNFRKSWHNLRVYNPIWRHPHFKWQQDTLFNKTLYSFQKYQPSPFYKYKIAKHTSKGKGRFFLKLRLTQPSIVQKRLLQNEQSSTHIQYNLEKALIALSQKLNIGVLKKNWIIPKGQQGLYFVMGFKRVRIINTLTTRSGYIAIISDNLVFITSKLKQKTSHLAIDQYELREDKTLHKSWPLQYIKEIFKRRYVNKKKSIQINFINGKSLILDFENEQELEEFSKKIMKLKNKCLNLAFLGKNLEPKKLIESLDYTKKWANFQITTFDYLMEINTIAGRAYADLTQYPVFPWTLIHFQGTKPDLSDQKQLRNLSLPMGANGSQDRIHNFQERYQIMQMEDQFATKFHYGTHYSSPGIIYHFLVRIQPYTKGSILLQSGRFDFADRLFDSLADSYKNATSQYSDVRQLVPELYCLPEAYLNLNGLDLGVMQNRKRVHNLGLPEWAKQNPYLFIYNFRKCLEEEYVGRNINNWIDLIFGYKQRGEQAINSLNCFYYLTYEDGVHWQMIQNQKDVHSIQSQIVNFGQTPSQIFVKPHPERNYALQSKSFKMICDNQAQARVYRPSKNSNKPSSPEYKQKNPLKQGDESIIYMKWVTQSKLAFVRKSGDIIFYKCVPNTNTASRIPFQCTVQKEKKIQKLKKNVFDPNQFYDPSLQTHSFPMEIIGLGHTLCLGGLSGGKLTTIDIDTGAVINGYHNHQYTISCIKSDPRENFLITGDIKGTVIMWQIKTSHNVSRLVEKKVIKDQFEQISSIYFSMQLQCFGIASFDASVFLYNFITGKKLRAYYHPRGEIVNEIIICSNPLAALVMFSNQDSTIYSYSINGQLIARVHQKQFSTFFSPIIIKDSKLFEYVAFGNQKSEINIKNLPFLELPVKNTFKVARQACVNKLCISRFNRFLVSGCSDGDLTIITDPNSVVNG